MYSNGNKIYISETLYYSVFRLKNRIILAPCDELKAKQKYFLRKIAWNYEFKPRTKQAANIHVGGKWILKMDIKSFYASSPSKAIYETIKEICLNHIENANINYYYDLVTLDNKLPTGAPTSGIIAHLCFKEVDSIIQSYCSARGINYSRYVDDLTFSSDSKILLTDVEKSISKILQHFGYQANEKKTKYISKNKQQNILGLVVNNEQTRVPKDLRRKIRARLHSYAIYKSNLQNKLLKHLAWNEKEISRLKGYLSYIKHNDKISYNQLKKYSKKLETKYNLNTLLF